ncbi:MAG: tetratricopeptide repeat protein [bacterium]|jgi:tetratricopeptide (TPR) repeat protein
MKDRSELLRQILAERPGDTLARYGLAMEYLKAGRAEEAVAEFRTLIAANPGYTYAYYHAGQALEKLGRMGEARAMYEAGLAHAADAHSRSELQAALDLLPED